MEFMAGTGMTPEKQEALGELARLCESQSTSAASIEKVAQRAADALIELVERARAAGVERMETSSAVRDRIRDPEAKAGVLADVSSGNWSVPKLAESLAGIADDLTGCSRSMGESCDDEAAKVSDILYHLTN